MMLLPKKEDSDSFMMLLPKKEDGDSFIMFLPKKEYCVSPYFSYSQCTMEGKPPRPQLDITYNFVSYICITIIIRNDFLYPRYYVKLMSAAPPHIERELSNVIHLGFVQCEKNYTQ